MRAWLLGLIAAIGLVTGVLAQPAQPDLARIAQLQSEIAALSAQYDGFLRQPQRPDAALSALNEDLRQTLAALAENYRLRAQYTDGPLLRADGSTLPEADRRRVLLTIANNIATQEREAERLKSQVESAERALFIAPGEQMHSQLLARIAERDRLLAAIEAAQGPLRVTGFSLVGNEGELARAEWSAVSGDQDGDAVVFGLERALAETRDEIAALGTQNREIAERLFESTRLWNAALQESIARNFADAVVHYIVQVVTDGIDVALSVASSGAWTTLRVALTAGDFVLKGTSQYAASSAALERMKALGREQLSDEVKAALAARIAAAIKNRTPIDYEELSLVGPSPLKPAVFGDDIFTDAVRAFGRESVKTAVSTAIEELERVTLEDLRARADTLPPGTFARFVLADFYDLGNSRWSMPVPVEDKTPNPRLVAGEPPDFGLGNSRWSMAAEATVADKANSLLARQLTKLTGSLGLSLGGTIVGAVRAAVDRIAELNDRDLAQALVRGQLEIFLLNESYQQSRAHLAALVALEPELVDGLAAARHRQALKGIRRLMMAGSAVERAEPIAVTGMVGPIQFRVDGAGSGAWRVSIRDNDGRELGSADGSAPGAVVELPATVIADLARRTQPVLLEILVSGIPGGTRVIDGDPATPAALDPETLDWAGWDGSADRYRLALTLVPPVTRTEPVRVSSPFEGNWIVTHQGYPEGGETISHYAIYRPWRAACSGRPTDPCEFATIQDAGTPLQSGIQSQFVAGSISERDGRLLIEHSNDYLGHWGSTEEIAAGGGDGLSGTWTSKDGTADNHPHGTTTWQRVVARPLLMVLAGNAETSSRIGEVGQVALSYDAFDWGPENNTPGTRPSFVVTLMGEDMWGHHVAEFRDTAGLQVRDLLPVWAGDLREPWAMRGVTFTVMVWPGATAGRKTLWFDGQPIAFDFVIEGR